MLLNFIFQEPFCELYLTQSGVIPVEFVEGYAKIYRDPVVFVHGDLIDEACHQHLFLISRALGKGCIPFDQNGL